MSRSYAQIASRVWNTALLLEPGRAEVITDLLLDRIGAEVATAGAPSVLPPVRAYFDDEDGERPDGDEEAPTRPYQVQDGVALIHVTGELVNRGSWMDAYSGITAYKTLEAQLFQARDDAAVRAILLDIDSPGGEAAGCMEVGALVREIDGDKPVTAFVDGQCCSAAYAIAAGAGTIVCAMSATVGSIGVLLVHMDRSARLAKDGLKPTILQKGKYKSDGTSLLPLDKPAAARIDALLESIYTLFVTTVSNFRPQLTAQDVRDTEAGVYIGADAVAAGLADRVGTFQDAIATLDADRAPPAPAIPEYIGAPMSTAAPAIAPTAVSAAGAALGIPALPPIANETAVAAAPAAAAPTPVPVPAAAPAPAAYAPPPAYAPAAAPPAHPSAAVAALQVDPMARARAIMNHPEAVGRDAMAKHLALETDNSVEAAAGILRLSARAGAPAEGTAAAGLLAEMSALQAPNLGPSVGAGAAPAVPPGPAKTQWQIDMEEGERTARELLGKPKA